MNPVLSREQFNRLPKQMMYKGRAFNAVLWRLRLDDGDWVVKDFSSTPWWYRWTVIPLAVGHECRVVQRLQGLVGVPLDPFQIDACAWGYRLIEGDILHVQDGTRCRVDFFERLERVVQSCHQRGVVHLDLRNARNILVDAQDRPHLIDFQSALFTRLFPSGIRRRLERIDLSGVYKHWLSRDAESLGAARENVLYWQLRLRHWWPWRGYRLPGRRRLYEAETHLLERHRQRNGRTEMSASETGL